MLHFYSTLPLILARKIATSFLLFLCVSLWCVCVFCLFFFFMVYSVVILICNMHSLTDTTLSSTLLLFIFFWSYFLYIHLSLSLSLSPSLLSSCLSVCLSLSLSLYMCVSLVYILLDIASVQANRPSENTPPQTNRTRF
jgi:hypothetical protein